MQGSWGKKWWGFLIESQDVPRCSLTSNVCVLTEHRQHVVASYPAARTLPWAEKAQQRPLETEAIARGALSSMLQKRTSLCREKQKNLKKNLSQPKLQKFCYHQTNIWPVTKPNSFLYFWLVNTFVLNLSIFPFFSNILNNNVGMLWSFLSTLLQCLDS